MLESKLAQTKALRQQLQKCFKEKFDYSEAQAVYYMYGLSMEQMNVIVLKPEIIQLPAALEILTKMSDGKLFILSLRPQILEDEILTGLSTLQDISDDNLKKLEELLLKQGSKKKKNPKSDYWILEEKIEALFSNKICNPLEEKKSTLRFNPDVMEQKCEPRNIIETMNRKQKPSSSKD